jgi:prophage tail gpP-like protein
LERVARWANFLLYDDPTGALVIAKLGDTTMASGFEQGQNVQAAEVTYRMDQRYTSITPVYLSTGYALDGVAVNNALPKAQAMDTSFPARADGSPRNRPLIVVSEQTQNDPRIAAARAQWEMARRFGRSQAVTVTCDSWRDKAGTLWTPNALAPLTLPSLKLSNALWLISDVSYRRGAAGTTCEVTLMPKQAFVPEPDFLSPFAWQVGQELPGGGAANYAPTQR